MFKRTIHLLKEDKFLFFAILLTIPPLFMWLSGGVSYVWSILYKFIATKTSTTSQIAILLLAPFVSLNLALVSYLKNKSKLSKKLFFLDLLLIVIMIATSFLTAS